MQYAGVSLTLKSGEKRAYEIACARHLLNGFGQRGLTSLAYGANEDEVKKEALQRNHDFKKRQITEYNVRNENRKHMGLGFLPPTDLMKKYAIELGIALLEPYNVRDEERSDIAQTKKENQDLRAEMAELKEMMQAIMSRPQTPKEPEEAPAGGVKWRK